MIYRLPDTAIILLCIFLLLLIDETYSQELAINEIMASNATTIADEDGDFEDWIELYNYGADAINLKGFGLSDDYDNPFRWIFPEIVIEPGEFLLIWASGKDRTDPEHPLHANFSISSTGEEILLTHPGGNRVDEISPTPVPTDISYGRYPDGGDNLMFFKEPTPGSENTTAQYHGILEPVTFSKSPGFYADTIWLELSHPHPDVDIYYTLDGSIPDKNAILYTSPIMITDRSGEDNHSSIIPTNFISGYRGWTEPDGKVAKATTIRTTGIKQGKLSPNPNSATFFIFPEAENIYSIDVISIISAHDAFFCDTIGIYVPGINYSEGSHGTGNYYQRGDEWEREGSLEFFTKDTIIQQDIGIRIHGGFSRRFPQKSFRLYARNEYGESRFNFKVFRDLPYSSYNRLLLRNSGNDWNFTMFRDAAAQSLVRHFDVDNQAYRPTVVFINGEYWGIKNLRERYDRHYLERVYGVDPDNVDLLTGRRTVKEGDNVHYNQMIDFISSNDLSVDSLFFKVLEMMDINNFLDYYSAQIYYGNNDWPHNNIDFWRLRVDYDSTAPKGHDGRWRWLMYDVDRSLGYSTNYRFDMIEWVTDSLNQRHNTEWPNIILRNLLANETFTHSFVSRITDHLNTAFIPERVHSVIDSLKSIVEPEIEEHIRRWGHPISKDRWDRNVQVMYTTASRRPAHVRQHIREHFNIERDVEVRLNVEDPAGGYIRINTIDVNASTPGVPDDTYPWTGIYFHGIPIEVEAVPYEGYAFSHWIGTDNQKEPVLNITPDGDINLKAHFVKTGYPEVISSWFFGTDLPNDTPLEIIPASYSNVSDSFLEFKSAFDGYPFEEGHENWRSSSMERRNAPTPINYHAEIYDDVPFEETDMRGIQVRQPLWFEGDESELIFGMPTLGYRDIAFRFAAMDEGAAERITVDYSVGEDEVSWTSSGIDNDTLHIFQDIYQLFEVDFSSVDEAENNPGFMVRIRFDGLKETEDDENRVTFNNFSLHGVPLKYNFYSKPDGDLADLSTWGSEPDGSGDNPGSFHLHTALFYVNNREETDLNSAWDVTGIDSRVIVGDDINNMTLTVNSPMNAVVDVMENATLELAGIGLPRLNNLKTGSGVIISNEAPFIPYASYHNLKINSIDPSFEEDGDIEIRGDLTLEGTVQMPDARDAHRYDLKFSGSGDQVISGNGNIVRGYNITFDKAGGKVSFSDENGGTILASDNQLTLNMGAGAMFEDSGIDIYAGNSVNIAGDATSYDFTGTLILADFEEGIVRGAGEGNNFNIRDSGSNNSSAVAGLNNLVVRAANQGGEYRFRDGGNNRFTVKGDLVFESTASGRIRFYNNQVIIGGNLIIENGFKGTVDTLNRILFNGDDLQQIRIPGIIHFENLTLDNPGNLRIDGIVQVGTNLLFETGRILVNENSLPKLGINATISGYGPHSFIDGPLGIYFDNIEPREVIFPIGDNDYFNPLSIETVHVNTNKVLYIAELFNEAPGEHDLPGGLLRVFDDFHYTLDILGDYHIGAAYAAANYDQANLQTDEDLLRMAKTDNGAWKNLGGEGFAGEIRSTIPFTSPGIFALAEQALEVTITSSAGEGGTIDPTGTYTVYQGSDKTYEIRAGNGYHISNLIVDGDTIPEAQGNFLYFHTFSHILDDRTIHAEFELNNYLEVNIYPNPARNILWVEFMQNIEYVAILSLYNTGGSKVAEKTLAPGDNTTGSISLDGIDPGIYMLEIQYGRYNISRRVVIIR